MAECRFEGYRSISRTNQSWNVGGNKNQPFTFNNKLETTNPKSPRIMKNPKPRLILLTIFTALALMVGCDNDDDNDVFADVTINEGPNGDIGGDFTGNGGSTSQTFEYQNGLATADYNADITASAGSIFQMIVRDADGTVVLDRSLNGNIEPDSFSGVTSSGTVGTWSVTINLTDFNGDGSFSLSEGD
ncbi:hypothetical protein [Maribacter polysaccharolyticus]|uniref:hypothetical protein n=1 Tax=Maribacter polysaccharolyticus TaxID=3020831 RepID=UPI00237F6A72|nr:hypothetical protein [Maribacter polysaccharolyticus]MDE3743412.1 hypothetical protein [Maribacter polysaccharolyticus]